MNKYGYADNKQAIQKRLNRIEGQVRGVSKMVEEDKYCIDIMTQINAAQAALDKVATELLRDHTKHCLANAKTKADQNQKADEIVDVVNRMLSR